MTFETFKDLRDSPFINPGARIYERKKIRVIRVIRAEKF
jgi:hypothetical protein